jgi:hypothetical protein
MRTSRARPAAAIVDPCPGKTGIALVWCEFWSYKGGVVY